MSRTAWSVMGPDDWKAHDEFVRAQKDRERRESERAMKSRAVAAMQIPPRILEVVRAEAWPTEAFRALADAPLFACLSGNPGNGKTIAAARWLHDRGHGLFVKSAQLARWERYSATEMAKILGASALVIDDLGTEYQDAKGSFMTTLDELLDYRYDHNGATVMTTNLDADAFKVRYGERIVDRIRECGKFVSIDAPSFRGRA